MELNKFRKEIADKFIAALKEDIIPWHQDWTSVGRPRNAITEQPYHGNNAFWLSYMAMERKYNDPRWCTFKQAGDNGWKIKKGEKGTRVEFFSLYDKLLKKKITSIEAENIRKQNPDEYNERIRLVSQTYLVFNGSQIIGIPEYIPEGDRNLINEYDLISCRDKIIKNMEVGFGEGGDRAYYSPIMDEIHMPEISSFETDYGYMSTFLHEAAHATGAKSRLDRDLTGLFGSKGYASEELRAEIASAFTAQLTGISYEQSEFMENHKAYVQSWISVLENNPNELFRAIKDAEKISDYLIEKGELLMEHKKSEYKGNESVKSEFEREIELHQDIVEKMDALGLEPIYENEPGFSDDFLMWRWKDGFVTKDYAGYEHSRFGVDGWEGAEDYINSIYDLINNYTLEELKNIEKGNYSVEEYGTYFYEEHVQVAIKNYADYRQQVQAIYDYEIANNIPENERMTKWYDDMNASVAKPWYKENDESVMDRPIENRHIGISEKDIAARYLEINKKQAQLKQEQEEGLIQGVEFAIDNGLQVSREDWETYKKITESRKSHNQNNNQKRGRSR